MECKMTSLTRNEIARRIRYNFDWESYLDSSGMPVDKQRGGKEWYVPCPHPECNDRIKPNHKCAVNVDKKVFQCWRCGFKTGPDSSVFDFIAFHEDEPVEAVIDRLVEELAEEAKGWDAPGERFEVPQLRSSISGIEALPTLTRLPGGSLNNPEDPRQKKFWEYLRLRGLTDQEILATQCRGWRGRVIFPVFYNHEIASWQARLMVGFEREDRFPHAKYLTAPGTDLGKMIWPCSHSKTAVVAEGIFDALAVRRLGYRGYCTFGKKISENQIRVLRRLGVQSVLLMWDKDAQTEIADAAARLRKRFPKVLAADLTDWPSEKDPGDALQDEVLLKRLEGILRGQLGGASWT